MFGFGTSLAVQRSVPNFRSIQPSDLLLSHCSLELTPTRLRVLDASTNSSVQWIRRLIRGSLQTLELVPAVIVI
jgi:hypothetical protein